MEIDISIIDDVLKYCIPVLNILFVVSVYGSKLSSFRLTHIALRTLLYHDHKNDKRCLITLSKKAKQYERHTKYE